MSEIKFKVAGFTDIGLGREKNDDSFLIDNDLHLYAVADGLGGLPDGDVASQIAVRDLAGLFKANSLPGRPVDWDIIFNDINKKIFDEGKKLYPEYGIATTLTALSFRENFFSIGHAGDSGIYLFRNREIQQLTRDHTVAQEIWQSLSEEKRKYTSIPEQLYHTLTRCLGQRPSLDIDFYEHELLPGDKLLLYTDGVTKTISEHRMGMLMKAYDTPEHLLAEIKKIAYEKEAPDNLSAIALFF
ncbi:MAG: hypothetical protein A2Y14_02415 [Verrucomicrobia bacterium GWF2_51_19]|nr:MAG: hypothetical protein A2Y14_02415 [Verrucomicrobia bacterium GWF2_51_19]HCJ11967.1 hypothetical protein [Opitutae bacterium]